MKMSSYQCRVSHFGDKTMLWLSYFQNGISYNGKMTSLYWIRALVWNYCTGHRFLLQSPTPDQCVLNYNRHCKACTHIMATSNDRHGVSNYCSIEYLFNHLFRQQRNIKGLHYWPFVRGIQLWLVDSPKKGPVMDILEIWFVSWDLKSNLCSIPFIAVLYAILSYTDPFSNKIWLY